MTAPEKSEHEFPDSGILWRGWNEETLRLIGQRERAGLLFVADPDPLVWPFLRETFKAMPGNARLRELLHEFYTPLYIEARALPDDLPSLIGSRLRRLGVGEELIGAELAAMTPVVVAPTVDRSVMGTVVDFAKNIPYCLEIGAWDDSTLPFVEARLAETPCHAARRFEEVVFPQVDAPKLLAQRWHAA